MILAFISHIWYLARHRSLSLCPHLKFWTEMSLKAFLGSSLVRVYLSYSKSRKYGCIQSLLPTKHESDVFFLIKDFLLSLNFLLERHRPSHP